MAPKPKKVARKSVEKHASPLVARIIEGCNAKALEGVKKNQNATGKWLEKMKLSVLRKLQATSKECFSGSGNPEELKAKIKELREKIKKQAGAIKASATKSMNAVKLSELSKPYGSACKDGRFSTKSQKVSDQFAKATQQLDEVGKDMHARLTQLSDTLTVIEGGWGTYSKSNPGAAAASAPAKRGPGRPSKASKAAAAASPDPALSSVHKHLSIL